MEAPVEGLGLHGRPFPPPVTRVGRAPDRRDEGRGRKDALRDRARHNGAMTPEHEDRSASPRRAHRLHLALVVLGALTFLGLVSASRLRFASRVGWGDAIGSGLTDWYLWAPLIPFIVLLARRFPFTGGRVWRALAIHGPGAIVASLLQIAAFAASSAIVRQVRFGTGSFEDALRTGFAFKFHTGVVVYGALVLGVQAMLFSERSRSEQLRRAELDRRLAEAQLRILQTHLQPHFLFNTLNAIAATVRSDPDAAERMIVLLGDLLRTALRHRDEQELSMREELAFLQMYVDIQKLRFGSRLGVEVSVAPQTLDARLPSFVLQPLVENAIRHGVASRPGPGRVRLDGRLSDGRLEIDVTDDGPGPGPSATAGVEGDGERTGLGLSNTRERLRLLYGDACECRLECAPGGGARVHLSLPLHREPA